MPEVGREEGRKKRKEWKRRRREGRKKGRKGERKVRKNEGGKEKRKEIKEGKKEKGRKEGEKTKAKKFFFLLYVKVPLVYYVFLNTLNFFLGFRLLEQSNQVTQTINI